MHKETLLVILAGLVMINGRVFGEEGAAWWESVSSAGIPGHNIRILENISLEDAKQRCIEGGFKSFDYEQRARRAFLQDVNMDDQKLKTDYKDNPYDHYTLRRTPQPISQHVEIKLPPPSFDRVKQLDQAFEPPVSPPEPAATRKPVGTVRAMTGDVWYGRSKEALETDPRPLKSGDAVWVSHFIKTSKNGRAVLSFGDGLAQMSIGSESTLDVRSYIEKVVVRGQNHTGRVSLFHLVKGYVRVVTGALFRQGDRLSIAMNNGVCGCRGTDFLVGHDEATNTDIVLVKDGVVDVTGAMGGQVIVRAGEQVRLSDGTPERVTPLDEALWLKHMPPERARVR